MKHMSTHHDLYLAHPTKNLKSSKISIAVPCQFAKLELSIQILMPLSIYLPSINDILKL